MAIKVGINGFGRIGRQTFKAMVENYGDEIEVGDERLAFFLKKAN
mgnify:CR=1 FL=1